jgi:hypothetical protein
VIWFCKRTKKDGRGESQSSRHSMQDSGSGRSRQRVRTFGVLACFLFGEGLVAFGAFAACLSDPASAYDFVLLVKDGGLAGGDGALRLVEGGVDEIAAGAG